MKAVNLETKFGSDLSFDAWLRYVFDHPVSKPKWYFEDATDPWADENSLVLSYITRLFNAPEFLLAAYGRSQVGEGLWFLANDTQSGYMGALHDTRIAASIRFGTISSITALFERLFAKACADTLGHLDQKGDDQLSMACYMWWDIFPMMPDPALPDDPEKRIADAFLNVMSSILVLPSEACRESALHGLNHLQSEWPERVARIVDGFLDGQTNLSAELRHYARRARGGSAL